MNVNPIVSIIILYCLYTVTPTYVDSLGNPAGIEVTIGDLELLPDLKGSDRSLKKRPLYFLREKTMDNGIYELAYKKGYRTLYSPVEHTGECYRYRLTKKTPNKSLKISTEHVKDDKCKKYYTIKNERPDISCNGRDPAVINSGNIEAVKALMRDQEEAWIAVEDRENAQKIRDDNDLLGKRFFYINPFRETCKITTDPAKITCIIDVDLEVPQNVICEL